MNFDEAVSYLLSLGNEMLAMKLGLANIERLLGALGNPHEDFQSIQIAGTNGKGSVASMVEASARAARIKTGLYTSPHLVSITERIRIDGQEIERERFAELATVVRARCEQIERETAALPTFFEQVTAIALLAFREARIELAILETGLGGRLDATTAARASVVAITPIALDHQEYLGATLALIAAEKAAIIRPGVAAAIIAPQETEIEALIKTRCVLHGVEARFATRALTFEGRCEEGRLSVSFETTQDSYARVCLALRGRHQASNASVAIALAEQLRERGVSITREEIIRGLETARHAGRLELQRDEISGLSILFDGAHNAAGARALRDYLDEFTAMPVTLVFGAMRDKQVREIASALFPAARRIILTRPDNARAASLETLARAVPASLDSGTITLAPSALEALQAARALTPRGGLICVTGSLYLVGEMKSILQSS